MTQERPASKKTKTKPETTGGNASRNGNRRNGHKDNVAAETFQLTLTDLAPPPLALPEPTPDPGPAVETAVETGVETPAEKPARGSKKKSANTTALVPAKTPEKAQPPARRATPRTGRRAARKGPITKEQSRLAEALAKQATDAESLNQKSMEILTRILINSLIVRKKLPHFYFHQEARRAGVAPDISRSWRIKEWPTSKLRNKEKFYCITEVLLRVQLRLWSCPQDETYWEANKRLKRRLKELMKAGYTHNRLSQYLRISFKTLKEILGKEEKKRCRPKHCPWTYLKVLENADDELKRRAIMSHTVHERKSKNRHEAEREEIEALEQARVRMSEQVIDPGQCCWNCGASWAALRYEGDTEAPQRFRWYKCYECERDNFTGLPRIDMYGECGTCGRPWPNLKKRGVDADGNTIRMCVLCLSHSVINQKVIEPDGLGDLLSGNVTTLELLAAANGADI